MLMFATLSSVLLIAVVSSCNGQKAFTLRATPNLLHDAGTAMVTLDSGSVVLSNDLIEASWLQEPQGQLAGGSIMNKATQSVLQLPSELFCLKVDLRMVCSSMMEPVDMKPQKRRHMREDLASQAHQTVPKTVNDDLLTRRVTGWLGGPCQVQVFKGWHDGCVESCASG